MKRSLKLVLGPVILLATVVLFARYLAQHTNLLRQLAHTPVTTIVWVVVLNVVLFGALVLLLSASLNLYGKRLGGRDNFLLSAYSSLVNFFGPGQSGPAVRAAYLKKRVGMSVKEYTFATLIYYGCFAVLNGFLVMAGSRPWWQTLIVVGIIAGVSFLVIQRFMRKRLQTDDKAKLQLRNLGGIFLATALQIATFAVMYGIELHAVHAHASVCQVITYTGVANLALFVALTPGAIGIRESFLVFSEKLHHISSNAIVGANLIDRGVYILFLGLLFVLVLSLHAKEHLHMRQLKPERPTGPSK